MKRFIAMALALILVLATVPFSLLISASDLQNEIIGLMGTAPPSSATKTTITSDGYVSGGSVTVVFTIESNLAEGLMAYQANKVVFDTDILTVTNTTTTMGALNCITNAPGSEWYSENTCKINDDGTITLASLGGVAQEDQLLLPGKTLQFTLTFDVKEGTTGDIAIYIPHSAANAVSATSPAKQPCYGAYIIIPEVEGGIDDDVTSDDVTSDDVTSDEPVDSFDPSDFVQDDDESSNVGDAIVDPLFKVKIFADDYIDGEELTVKVTIYDIPASGVVAVQITKFVYDTEKLVLNNEVLPSGALDCISTCPGDEWQGDNFSKINADGTLTLSAMGGLIDASQLLFNDGGLVFTLNFTVVDDIEEDLEFLIANTYINDKGREVNNVRGTNAGTFMPVAASGDYHAISHKCASGHTPGADADCENDQICTVCGDVLATATGHHHTSSVTPPTCTEDGYTTYTCPDCGDSYVSDVVGSLGHTPGAAADCINDQVCTVCGDVLATALGHTPGAAADCENDQVCTVCGDVLATALGHTPGAAADCENDQVCTVCGDVLATALGHTPGAAADCENDQVCTVCGDVLATALGHTPGAAADCENDQVCTVCGDVLATALGHTPGAAADCENDQVCTVCGDVLATALGHTPGAAADCENDQVCTVCGDVLATALGHTPGAAADCENDQVCAVCGDVLATALGHTPGAAADCENDQICTVCGDVLATATGHHHTSSVTPPTCTEDGYTTYTCPDCGDSYVSDVVGSLGHTPGAAADCENDQVCTVCGDVLATALGHTPGAAADCENDQICTVCGDVLATALGHTPGAAADCENDQVCTVCGDVLATALGHTPGAAADCENDQVCTVCGDVLATALGHTPGAAADCENDQVCTVCGDVLATALGHTPGAAADCENDQVCTVCGDVLATALGHTPGAAADCVNDQVCTVCGDVLATALGHTPGAAADCVNDQVCTVCGDVLATATGHHHTSSVTPPTCTEDGYTTYTCPDCGDSYVSDVVGSLGHTPGAAADCVNDQVCTVCGDVLATATGHHYTSSVTPPTCTEDGYTTYTCPDCGDSYVSDVVGSLGHTPGAAADCVNDQVCTVCGDVLATATGHHHTSSVTPPTCTEDGYTTYTCPDCGDSYVDDVVGAHGHGEGEWTTLSNGDQEFRCEHCGLLYDIWLLGDVNADDVVDVFDYLTVKSIYFGSHTPTEQEQIRANVSEDDAIDLFDYMVIKSIAIYGNPL